MENIIDAMGDSPLIGNGPIKGRWPKIYLTDAAQITHGTYLVQHIIKFCLPRKRAVFGLAGSNGTEEAWNILRKP
jgi:hypothetical protein